LKERKEAIIRSDASSICRYQATKYLTIINFVVVLMFLISGCRSYGWKLFKWNWLACTPYEDAKYKTSPLAWDNDTVTVAWLGHSTVLINFFGTTILTDPVLGKRIYSGESIGIRRIVKLPVKISELPDIDVVLISHAHQDHWDINSLKKIGLKKFKNSSIVIVPKQVELRKNISGKNDYKPVEDKSLIEELIPHEMIKEERPFDNVVRRLYWEEKEIITKKERKLTIKAIRVNHWGLRFDIEKILYRTKNNSQISWNGYVISDGNFRIFFAGDTANGDWFNAIKDPQKHFDLVILPIGTYYFSRGHISPEDSWKIFESIKGNWFLPIHWRTLILAPVEEEPIMEPLKRLDSIAQSKWKKVICYNQGMAFDVLNGKPVNYKVRSAPCKDDGCPDIEDIEVGCW
jgi:L-ascorbate metabolism protein UlaG (beta-lactamase superfamily)